MNVNYLTGIRFLASAVFIFGVVWINNPYTQFVILIFLAFGLVYYCTTQEEIRFKQAAKYRKAYFDAQDVADDAEEKYEKLLAKFLDLYQTVPESVQEDFDKRFKDYNGFTKNRRRKHYTPDQIEAWEILGVAKGATQDASRRAYRKKVRLSHPDMGGDPSKMTRYNWAKEVLNL